MTSSRMCIFLSDTHVFVFIFTSSIHAHLGTNSSLIDIAHVALAKVDPKYIAMHCSCVLLKFRSDISHIYQVKNHRDVIKCIYLYDIGLTLAHQNECRIAI